MNLKNEYFSAVIPTMQKNKKVLYMLINQLLEDSSVDEIIIIDNSLEGIDISANKIKIITPKENIYVNPAWNVGVKESKNDYVALLNDDLILPPNLLNKTLKFFKTTENIGFIGLDTIEKSSPEDFIDYPKDLELCFEKIDTRCVCWGCVICFNKNDYIEIPENIKVWCGDDFLFDRSQKLGKNNYKINNSNVLHLHSLTSNLEDFSKIKLNDQLEYRKITPDYIFDYDTSYKVNFIKKVFSIQNYYTHGIKKKAIFLFGIKITIKIG